MTPVEDGAREVATRSEFRFNPLEGWGAREVVALGVGFLAWLLLSKIGGLPNARILAHPLTGIALAVACALIVHYSTRKPRSDATLLR